MLYANTEESRQLIEESRRKRMGMPAEDIRTGDEGGDDEEFGDDFDDDDDDDVNSEDSDVDDTDSKIIEDNKNKEDK